MQAVILAAGKGTRLRPITLTRSKAMAPVAGKPMIERVMETIVENGVRRFIVVVSDDDRDIRPYFQSQTSLPATFQFVIQPERLGMANALSLAAPYLHGEFILSACDSIVPPAHVAGLLAAHQSQAANATLSLMELSPAQVSKSSAVDWHNGAIRRIVEKPAPGEAPSNIGSLPLYVFSPRVLDYLPEVQPSARGEYELQDAIQMLIERDGRVGGVLTRQRAQLTNVEDLLDLNRHYLNQLNGAVPEPPPLAATIQLRPPVYIEAGADIGPGCVIGPHVTLEAGCRIGPNAHVQNAVIMAGAVIETGRHIAGKVIT
jgi:bifunctional UDP-N-acetylglucosamine pyrophosphorylase/glucosamine-1-phosphate N-acetyltransferase